VEVGVYLRDLVRDLGRVMSSASEDRAILVESDNPVWPASEASILGLVLTELLTNALKYGHGTVTATFREPPGGAATLAVVDEGAGLPAGFEPASNRGFGMRIVAGLLRASGGDVAVDHTSPHTRFVATFPRG